MQNYIHSLLHEFTVTCTIAIAVYRLIVRKLINTYKIAVAASQKTILYKLHLKNIGVHCSKSLFIA